MTLVDLVSWEQLRIRSNASRGPGSAPTRADVSRWIVMTDGNRRDRPAAGPDGVKVEPQGGAVRTTPFGRKRND